METERISEENIKEALSRSGYFLETRVLNILKDKNYKNTPNYSYPDGITGKSREIDIYSESERITDNLKLNFDLHFEFWHRLIIECSNNPQPAVFFKRPDKSPYTIFGKFQYAKTEREIAKSSFGPSPDFEFLSYVTESKQFHYNKFDTNTQYCSFSQKKDKDKEWMASHIDGLHDTFNKLFDCTLHTNQRITKWIPKSAWKNELFVVLQFPLLVLQNEIYEAQEKNGEIELIKKNHIVFEFNRYKEKNETLLIDVITENYFNDYLGIVINDMVKLKNHYRRYYKDKKITAANTR